MAEPLVEIRDLVLRYYTYEGVVKALEGVDLLVKRGETLGIVGETGSGKTVTALAVMGIVTPPGRIEEGSVLIRRGEGWLDMVKQPESVLRGIRGRVVSMIFQEPSQALNPVYTIADQVGEVYLTHTFDELCSEVLDEVEREMAQARAQGQFFRGLWLSFQRRAYRRLLRNRRDKLLQLLSHVPGLRRYRERLAKKTRQRVVSILRQMEIPDPERVADSYPHQLSGGMKQRVVIAMALAARPALLIADEPTTSLDVTIEAQILDLMRKMKREYGATLMFITHDFGLIAEMASRVAVMYAGNVVEVADVKEIFLNPLHPYTQGLLRAIPKVGAKELQPIEGVIPNLVNPPSGCRFHPRCPYAMEVCKNVSPTLKSVREEHYVACHLY